MKFGKQGICMAVVLAALPSTASSAEAERKAGDDYRAIMTHTKVEECVAPSPPPTLSDSCKIQKIPPESYTRLVIEDLMPPGSLQLTNEDRDAFWRLFSSKDITFQASITATAGRFKEVTPLIYRRYESSRRSGENFSREITLDDRLFPLFLVTGDPGNQIASFVFDAKFDNKSSTDAAEMSIDFLSTALKAVSPTSAVVTTLTSDNAEKVAAKIDEGIGKFFSQSVSEKSRFDIDLYDFKPVTLTVFGAPTEEKSFNPGATIIGKWKISFADARPSIFSSIKCEAEGESKSCPTAQKKAAFDDARLRPNAVLAFPLIDKIGNSGTVLSYLKQQEWWATDLVALSSQNPPQVGAFCRKIRGAIGEIGLSDTDGRIIAYSVSESGSVTDKVKGAMQAEPDCKLL